MNLHSPEAERMVIGSILIRPRLWHETAEVLHASDFTPPQRDVWEAMAVTAAKGRSPEAVAVEGIDWDTLLALANEASAAVEALPHYAAIVREKSQLRRAYAALGEAQARFQSGDDVIQVIEAAQSELTEALSHGATRLEPAVTMAPGLLAEFERRMSAPDPISGVRFGVHALDDITCGLRAGQLAVVAADTGSGKTAMAMQACFDTILRGGAAMAINMEMPREELLERWFCWRARVNSHSLRRGQIQDSFRRLHDAAADLDGKALYLEDMPVTLRDIGASLRAFRAKHRDMQAIGVVDFLQLMSVKTKDDTRARQLGIVAQGLKRLAKQIKLPIILVSQLNRGPARADRQPSRTDLKESGDIEQAADVIVLIHNKTETGDDDVDIIVDKHRGGPTGRVRARFVGRYYAFEDAHA